MPIYIGGRVDDQVWEKSLQQTLIDMGEFIFYQWYRKVTAIEKSILKILADAQAPLTLKQIQHIAIDKNTGIIDFPDSLTALLNNGLIHCAEDSNERFEISDKMFKAYINFLKLNLIME